MENEKQVLLLLQSILVQDLETTISGRDFQSNDQPRSK